MPSFGFSAFLKLICLAARPSRSEVRRRLGPSEGGYDFHRSLRLRAHRYLVGGVPIAEVMESVSAIVRAPEQASARSGLERLDEWRRAHPGPVMSYPPATYESPAGLYKVTFTPDFGLSLGGQGVAIHVWNTAQPDLIPRMVYAALALIAPEYAGLDNAPDDVAVLSLPEMRLYRLSEAGRYATLGVGVGARIEELIRDVQHEIDRPPSGDRPDHGPRRG
jgi:hypothetical protein